MIVTTPVVTGRLKEITEAIINDPHDLIERLYRAVISESQLYENLSSVIKNDIFDSFKYWLELWIKATIKGEGICKEDLEILEIIAHRRVHQNIPIEAFLSALRTGAKELWKVYLELAQQEKEIKDQVLFLLSPYLLDHFDVIIRSVEKAYLEEQYQKLRWKEALRHELCNLIFSGVNDIFKFEELLESLGHDPTLARVAIVMDIQIVNSSPMRLESDLDILLNKISKVISVEQSSLIRTMYHSQFAVWIPCIRGDNSLNTDLRIAKFAKQILKEVSEVKKLGIGLMGSGPNGWFQSLCNAVKALDFGKREDKIETDIFYFSDIALQEGARQLDNVLQYLESVLDRLSHEQDLLRTLECFLEQMLRRKQTAYILGIHPNTLNYRLDRIKEITGGSLEDPIWIAKFQVALKLRKESL